MTNAVQLPVCQNDIQRPRMGVKKKTVRLDLMLDKETLEALNNLLEKYAGEKNKSDIIREAIIEKADRDGALLNKIEERNSKLNEKVG